MKIKNILSLISSNLILSFLTSLSSIFIARFYGPSMRGDFASFISLTNLLVSIFTFGTATYLANYLVKNKLNNKNLKLIFIKIIVPSSLAVLTFFFLLKGLFIENKPFVVEIIIIIFYVPISILSILILNINLSRQEWKSFNVSKISFGVFNLILLALFFLFFGKNYNNLIMAIFLSNCLCVSLQFYLTKNLFVGKIINISALNIFKNSKHYGLNSIVNVLNGQADILIFAYLSNSINVGYWAVARTFGIIINPFNQGISNWIFSIYSNELNHTEIKFSRYFRVFIILNVIFSIPIIIFSKYIIPIVFGNDYLESINLVPYAVLGLVCASLSEIIEEKFRGSGDPKIVSFIRIIPVFFFMIICLIFNTYLSILNVSIFFSLSQLIRLLSSIFFNSKLSNDKFSDYLIPKKGDFNFLKIFICENKSIF